MINIPGSSREELYFEWHENYDENPIKNRRVKYMWIPNEHNLQMINTCRITAEGEICTTMISFSGLYSSHCMGKSPILMKDPNIVARYRIKSWLSRLSKKIKYDGSKI